MDIHLGYGIMKADLDMSVIDSISKSIKDPVDHVDKRGQRGHKSHRYSSHHNYSQPPGYSKTTDPPLRSVASASCNAT